MQTIYLDISNKGVIPTINAKQGEVGRKFLAILTDAGVPYIAESGTLFSVWYEGASGEGNYSQVGGESAFEINGNKISIELITQMLTNHGDGIVSLVMSSTNGDEIATWNIPYSVEKKPGAESEEATAYYTALSEVAGQAAESADRAEEAAATFETDESLSVVGKSADAAAVGAALEKKANAIDVGEMIQELDGDLRQYTDDKVASIIESGEWTPTLVSGADSLTGFSQCTYHKTGNIVHVSVLCWGTFTNRNDDQICFSLPFAVGSTRSYGLFGYNNSGLTDLYIYAGGGNDRCEIKQHNASGQEVAVTGTSIGRDSWTFQFSLTYGTDVMDGADGEDGENGDSASITVDSELSETSENPVQNKVITENFSALAQEFSTALGELSQAIPTEEQVNALIDAKLANFLNVAEVGM